jgi:hypothetical protein
VSSELKRETKLREGRRDINEERKKERRVLIRERERK